MGAVTEFVINNKTNNVYMTESAITTTKIHIHLYDIIKII